LLLMVVALPLAGLALRFGPPETFALLLVGLSLVTGLAGRSLVAALLMTCLGLMLALVGMDPVRGAPRFTFDLTALYDGVGFVPVVMGLFGIGEMLASAERPVQEVIKTKLSAFLPQREEWGASLASIGRGTFLGFFLGLIPGIGAIVPTFLSYVMEKRLSRHPERFGTGAIEGVAGPETANNAYATGAMVPLLAIGIPGSPTLAVLMGAFIINGITPGPFLFQDRPALVWGVIASFYIGNAMLLVLNLPLVGLWAKMLEVKWQYQFTAILVFCILGAYSLRQSTFDVGLMLVFGVLGYVFRKLDWPMAPAVLALILGPMLERALRTSLEMSNGDLGIFVERPAALGLLVLTAIIIISSTLRFLFLRRARTITQEGGSASV
jgi:putative tricarboxylic transport membrane protein